jgi:hypothetical protein
MLLKGDIVNGAYEEMRIWGITSSPSKVQKAMSLRKLEAFCAEFKVRNICFGYNFESTPDLNSPAGINDGYRDAVQIVLGAKLLSQFGKTISPTFKFDIDAAYSFIVSSTALFNETNYPSRQALGSGNTVRYGTDFQNKFYPELENVPAVCDVITLYDNAVEDYTENYSSYLVADGETISSHVMTSGSGIAHSGDTLDSPDISYRVTASDVGTWELKIVVTTSTGRINTRIKTFVIEDSDI